MAQTVTSRDVERAFAEFKQAEKTAAESKRRLDACGREIRWLQRRLWLAEKQIQLRHALASALPPLHWAIIFGATVAAVSMILTLALDATLGTAFLVGVPVAVVAGALCYVWFNYTKQLPDTIPRLHHEMADARQRWEECRHEYDRLKAQAYAARHEYQRLKAQFEDIFNQLRLLPWQRLEAGHFEQFLAALFRAHGCQVEQTGGSGDHAVDLVVVTPGGIKVAVQAKGYPSGNRVGNNVVLRVLGGKEVYGCQMAAVVTNSDFTSTAVDAARKGGCLLLNKAGIAALLARRANVDKLLSQAQRGLVLPYK